MRALVLTLAGCISMMPELGSRGEQGESHESHASHEREVPASTGPKTPRDGFEFYSELFLHASDAQDWSWFQLYETKPSTALMLAVDTRDGTANIYDVVVTLPDGDWRVPVPFALLATASSKRFELPKPGVIRRVTVHYMVRGGDAHLQLWLR